VLEHSHADETTLTLSGSVFSIKNIICQDQTNITTLGTIATGTWNATAIGATKGGTGQTVYAVGDLLYASTTTALSKLTIGANNYVLTSDGHKSSLDSKHRNGKRCESYSSQQ
jgi:outer membrane lipoprotein SlyB